MDDDTKLAQSCRNWLYVQHWYVEAPDHVESCKKTYSTCPSSCVSCPASQTHARSPVCPAQASQTEKKWKTAEHFSTREQLGENHNPVVPSINGKAKGKEKENCHEWICEDWTEYLAVDARVAAWKLHKEVLKTKEWHQDAQLKFFRLDDMGTQRKALQKDLPHQVETGNTSLIVKQAMGDHS